MTGPVPRSILVFDFFLVFSLLFSFVGSVRQTKLVIRQLLGACKYSVSCRIVSNVSCYVMWSVRQSFLQSAARLKWPHADSSRQLHEQLPSTLRYEHVVLNI